MKRLELERASENQNRAEVEEKLYSGTEVTNPRDYYRMELRVQEHANRINAIDERMEPIREATNEARQVHSDLQSQLDEMEAAWTEQKQVGTDEQTRISHEYNEALKHRNETADKIPEDHLGEYTRLFKSNGGVAVTVGRTRYLCRVLRTGLDGGVECSQTRHRPDLVPLRQVSDHAEYGLITYARHRLS